MNATAIELKLSLRFAVTLTLLISLELTKIFSQMALVLNEKMSKTFNCFNKCASKCFASTENDFFYKKHTTNIEYL